MCITPVSKFCVCISNDEFCSSAATEFDASFIADCKLGVVLRHYNIEY